VGREQRATGSALRVRVPAKLNLFLSVRGRRGDGFHELVTVFQTVSLFDTLRLALVGLPGRRHHPAGRRRMRIELWAGPSVPQRPDNLAYRAAVRLGRLTGTGRPGGHEDRDAVRTVIDLDKAIPMAAGLAGGSADAAGALVGLNRLWRCRLTTEQLRTVGAELGSDVPFCIGGGTALGTGRGTEITPVLSRGPFHWVICPDAEPLSTPEVYREWDRRSTPGHMSPDEVLFALRSGDPERLAAALHNELEPAAFTLRPHLAVRRRRLLEAGALGVVLAGSGPTLLALTGDAVAAQHVAAAIAGAGPPAIVGVSPAGGPEVTPVPDDTDASVASRTLQ
jgi:4-diphosphocytidyl-2-C-methyl-D-erythritol kinase